MQFQEVITSIEQDILSLPAAEGLKLLLQSPRINQYIENTSYKVWSSCYNRAWEQDDYHQYLLIALYESIEKYKANPSKPLSYYFHIRIKFQISKAKQLVFSKKEQTNAAAVDIDSMHGVYSPSVDLSEGVLFKIALESALDKMRERSAYYAKCVEMFNYRLQGYTVKEICKMLSCSDSYVYESLKIVRRFLEQEGVFN